MFLIKKDLNELAFQRNKTMSQLKQITQTLNQLADSLTTPDDVIKTATERGDTFEKIFEELDAQKRQVVACSQECVDIIAAAQRLKEAMDARATTFNASLLRVVEARCRDVEAEYDALITARLAEVEALREEKAEKVCELLSLVDFDSCGASDGADHLNILRQINQLVKWTGKTSGVVVYDSKVDEFTDDGLFNKTKGKENIALVATTSDGDVFGGFYSVAVDKQNQNLYDPNMFAFSFESHGRCETPQRFVVKERLKEKAWVGFYQNCSWGFVEFVIGNGFFTVGNQSSNSYCNRVSQGFEGLQDRTLTGKDGSSQYYHCTRLLAIQLS